jgi:hypothetical protein
MSVSKLSSEQDKEKGGSSHVDGPTLRGTTPEQIIPTRFGVLGPVLAKMFASGVEARGVERVPEDERETKNMWNK